MSRRIENSFSENRERLANNQKSTLEFKEYLELERKEAL
jgi:hypothetical protein